MGDSGKYKPEDEIDVATLFRVLWTKKNIIFFVSLILSLASYVMVKGFTNKQYTATGVFAFYNAHNNNPFGGFAGLAGLAGLSEGSFEQDNLVPQATGRVFLEPFFRKNSLNILPDLQKNIDDRDSDIIAFEKSFQLFRENHLSVVETRNGPFQVSVTLQNPVKAAEIVNELMDDFIFYKKDETARKSLEQLRYYSGEIARIQDDVDKATTAVEEFALKANILSEGEFASQSLLLENLRERIVDTTKYFDDLNMLMVYLDKVSTLSEFRKKASKTDYGPKLNSLTRSAFQKDWRLHLQRMLEDEISLTEAQKNTLVQTLKQTVANTETIAKEASEFRKLKQKAKIEVVALDVFTEQFKKQQVIGGFSDQPGQVFEYAVAPLAPSKPRVLIISIMTFLLSSLFLSILCILNDYRKPKFWSSSIRNFNTKAENMFHKNKHSALMSKLIFQSMKRELKLQLFLPMDHMSKNNIFISSYLEHLARAEYNVKVFNLGDSSFSSNEDDQIMISQIVDKYNCLTMVEDLDILDLNNNKLHDLLKTISDKSSSYDYFVILSAPFNLMYNINYIMSEMDTVTIFAKEGFTDKNDLINVLNNVEKMEPTIVIV